MKRAFSLRFKLSVPVAILALLILGAMTLITSVQSFRSAEEDAQSVSLYAARAYSEQAKKELEAPLGLARTYAHVVSGKLAMGVRSREHIMGELKSLLANNPELIGTWTGWEPNAFDNDDARWVGKPGHDQSGRFVPYWSFDNSKPSLSPLVGYEKQGEGDFYLVPKARLKETLVEPYSYLVAGAQTLMTSAVVPVIVDGNFRGVVGVDLGLTRIQSIVSKIKPFATSEAYLVSNAGNWVSHPSSALITKAARFPFRSAEVLAAIKAGNEFTAIDKDPQSSTEYLYTVVPLKVGNTDQPWGMVIRTPTETILASANSLVWTQVLISVAGIFILIAAVFFIAHLIGKKLIHFSSNLQTSTAEVSSAIHLLTDAGHQLSKTSTDSAASVEETVASLEEVNSMVKRNSENAKAAAELSKSSVESAHSGEAEVQGLIEKMTDISASSKKIEDIIHVIDDIAFQTNLLALNAAVEAARAGEQGKGFSVVADAVRTLAHRSADAAKEINTLIHSSVEQVTEGTKRAEASGVVLKKIVDSIAKVSNINEEIAKASEEQAVGLNQISTAMNQLDRSIQSNASSAEQIAASSVEIDSQSNSMKIVVNEISVNIQGKKAA